MNVEAMNYLERFYDRLCDGIRKVKKEGVKDRSLIEIFLDTTSGNRRLILKESYIRINQDYRHILFHSCMEEK